MISPASRATCSADRPASASLAGLAQQQTDLTFAAKPSGRIDRGGFGLVALDCAMPKDAPRLTVHAVACGAEPKVGRVRE